MRLATFNILHGRSLDDGRVDVDRLAAAVRRLDADVLALQEVDRNQPRSNLADLTEVAAEAMGAVSHRFVAALSGAFGGGPWMAATEDDVPGQAAYGVALLSRYPVSAWQVVRLPRIRPRFPLYLREPRKVIVVHEEPRAAVVASIETPAGCVSFACTHLSFVPGWGRWQLRQLRQGLDKVEGPAVIMGDLNMAGDVPARLTGYQALAARPTFPADQPVRQLDHILVRGDIGRVTATEAPRLDLSDHRPLVVDVEVEVGHA